MTPSPKLLAGDGSVKFSRHWDMPNANTFAIPTINGFVKKYLLRSQSSVDPFARNNRLATVTNDIDPSTSAQHHQESEDFLMEMRRQGRWFDLAFFDPPYSPRQLKECYNSMGRKMQLEDGQTARLRKIWKDALAKVLLPNAVVLSFGWNSVGMGKQHGFEIVELMLVCHGADHNDTICLAEQRLEQTAELAL